MSNNSDAQEHVQALLDAASVTALAETFKVLGDPTRIRILDALAHGERCVGDLAGLLAMTESAVSHQLRLLRGMHVVRTRRAGQQIYYALDDQHIVRLLAQGLEHVRERTAAAHLVVPAAVASAAIPAPRPRAATPTREARR